MSCYVQNSGTWITVRFNHLGTDMSDNEVTNNQDLWIYCGRAYLAIWMQRGMQINWLLVTRGIQTESTRLRQKQSTAQSKWGKRRGQHENRQSLSWRILWPCPKADTNGHEMLSNQLLMHSQQPTIGGLSYMDCFCAVSIKFTLEKQHQKKFESQCTVSMFQSLQKRHCEL